MTFHEAAKEMLVADGMNADQAEKHLRLLNEMNRISASTDPFQHIPEEHVEEFRRWFLEKIELMKQPRFLPAHLKNVLNRSQTNPLN